MDTLQDIVGSIHQSLLPLLGEGTVASYIPQLAKVDPNQFGIAVLPLEGAPALAGDFDTSFSIQSVSKVFSLALVLQLFGEEQLAKRVGMEPSGNPFYSLVQLEYESRKPRNPFGTAPTNSPSSG